MKTGSARKDEAILSFHRGGNYRAYELLGSHSARRKGQSGMVFRVWAPNAQGVSLVGDFNGWEPEATPLEEVSQQGLWEVFVPGLGSGQRYQYVLDCKGVQSRRPDPYAYIQEAGVSKTCDLSRYGWKDQEWLQGRRLRKPLSEPMNIYEVHLGSWKRGEDGSPLSYRQLAKELAPYAAQLGYTHIQLLPVMEHEDEREQYNISAYFAPSCRYGSPKDLMYFVDQCHQQGLGVLLDWVPGHFPKKQPGLARFDGGFCYESEDNDQWSSALFDYSRPEVNCFLISNAYYWLEKYHIDGLRVDGVSAMLTLNLGKERRYPQGENPGSLEFLKRMNSAILTEHPDVLMMAEEAQSWPMVTKPPYTGGLGFHLKWNNGWSHDMLHYMSMDPIYRVYNHDKITFSLMYAFSENFILPLSHDEFSGGRGSLMGRMPGEHKSQFASVRAFLGYFMAHPGKKLLFMGCELGQFLEWNSAQALDWGLLDYESHRKLQTYVKDLNHFYRANRPLWEVDNSWDGFQWLVHDDQSQCVVAFRRSDEQGRELLAICNFSPVKRENYRIGVPRQLCYEQVFSSDALKYGGDGLPEARQVEAQAQPMHGKPYSICLDIPPLCCLYLRPTEESDSVL